MPTIDPALLKCLAQRGTGPAELDALKAMIVCDPVESEIDILQNLLEYYRDLPDHHPSRIDPTEYPKLASAMGYIMILDVLPGDYFYRLYGSKIAKIAGFDMTGKKTSDIPFSLPGRFFLGCYDWVCQTKRIVESYHLAPAVVNALGWHRLALPFEVDGRVTRLLVGNVNEGARYRLRKGSPSL